MFNVQNTLENFTFCGRKEYEYYTTCATPVNREFQIKQPNIRHV